MRMKKPLFKGIPKAAATVGLILVALAGLFYVAAEVTSSIEQARTPGEENMGVAVLGMIFGLPMFLCVAGAVLSFLISAVALAYETLIRHHSAKLPSQIDN